MDEILPSIDAIEEKLEANLELVRKINDKVDELEKEAKISWEYSFVNNRLTIHVHNEAVTENMEWLYMKKDHGGAIEYRPDKEQYHLKATFKMNLR